MMRGLDLVRKKRVLLPLMSLGLVAAAALVAILRSNASRIMVYNQTDVPVAALRIAACGQSTAFGRIEPDDSIRWTLAPGGRAGEIELETAVDPPWRWRGGYIEPQGGYRVTLRLWPDGEVETDIQVSFWQRLFHDALGVSESANGPPAPTGAR